jgi:hypothetical protein
MGSHMHSSPPHTWWHTPMQQHAGSTPCKVAHLQQHAQTLRQYPLQGGIHTAAQSQQYLYTTTSAMVYILGFILASYLPLLPPSPYPCLSFKLAPMSRTGPYKRLHQSKSQDLVCTYTLRHTNPNKPPMQGKIHP